MVGKRLNRFFLFALFIASCLIFINMGFYRNVYPCMHAAGLSAAFCLTFAWVRSGKPGLPYVVYLPLVLFAYIALLPGWFEFTDAKRALWMLECYLAGMGIACFWDRKSWILPFCLMTVLTMTFGYWIMFSPDSFTHGAKRLRLMLNHPNILAMVVAWCSLFLFSRRAGIPDWLRIPMYLCFGLALALLSLTGGRSAYIGIVFAVAITGVCLLRRHLGKIVLALAVISLFCSVTLPQGESQRLMKGITNLSADTAFRSRLPYWYASIQALSEKPLFGHTHKAFGPYLKNYLEENKEQFAGYRAEEVKYPHNLFFELLFSWGIVGTLLFFAILIPGVREAATRRDIFFFGTFFMTLGYGIFDSFLHTKDGALILFFPLGLLYGDMIRPLLRLEAAIALPDPAC